MTGDIERADCGDVILFQHCHQSVDGRIDRKQGYDKRVLSWAPRHSVNIEYAREFAKAILAVCDAMEKEPSRNDI